MVNGAFDRIVQAIKERMPLHANFLNNTLKGLEKSELVEADAYCSFLLEKHEFDFIIAAYQTVVDDTFATQVEFLRTKHYRYSTFAETAASVYFDPSYMNKYMVGLALTTFLWPNHVEIYRFFRETLPRHAKGPYLEIGPGHGFFFLQALRHGSFDKLIGVDLSPSSIALTKDVVTTLASERRQACSFIEMDFLNASSLVPPFAAIVMGEVLEHVEKPQLFLRRIAELASPDTHIFVTTCVNAPAVDHIYLFRKTTEAEQMISECGLKIRSSKTIPYPGKTIEQCAGKDLPINVAYVLSR